MYRRNLFCFLILLSTFVSSCASLERGQSFEPINLSNLTIGESTKAQFIELFGKPFEYHTFENEGAHTDILIYQYGSLVSRQDMRYRTLGAEFINGIFYGYVFQSSFNRDSTNFNEHLRSKLLPNVASKQLVTNTLGNPSGIMFVPTMLNDSLLGDDWLKEVKGIKEIWLYWFADFVFENNKPIKKQKKLLLGFNQDGILTDSAFQSDF